MFLQTHFLVFIHLFSKVAISDCGVFYIYYLIGHSKMVSEFRLEDAIHVGCNEYGWDLRIDMVMMRTMYPNMRASDIYLGKNLCTGLDYGSYLLFHQGLRECITSETVSQN